MKSRRALFTAGIALAAGTACFLTTVKDGGNTDFYWKPLLAVWYALTAVALTPLGKNPRLAWLRERGWLQIVVPVALLGLALLLARVHEPFPLPQTTPAADQRDGPTR